VTVKEKLAMNRAQLEEHGPITIAVFGDSVSHGAVNGYIDYENVYWNQLRQRLNRYRDYVPVNVINAAIGGTTAWESLPRMEKQVFAHHPDLVIVCFGLNDVNGPLERYGDALRQILRRCRQEGCETILLTPNMLNTTVAEDTAEGLKEYAQRTAEMQNSGRMDTFMDAARAVALELEVPVCDVYARWKALAETRDITPLLANRINHPIPEMHRLFAEALYDVIMGDAAVAAASDSTMYAGQPE